MNPWPFILASYGVTLAGLLALGLGAFWRAGRASRRLAAAEAALPAGRGRGAP